MLLEAVAISELANLLVDAHEELSKQSRYSFLRNMFRDQASTDRFTEDVKKVVEKLDIRFGLDEVDEADLTADFLMEKISRMIRDADSNMINPKEVDVLGPTNLRYLSYLPLCTIQRAFEPPDDEGGIQIDPNAETPSTVGFWVDNESLPELVDGSPGQSRLVFSFALEQWAEALEPVNVNLEILPVSMDSGKAHVFVSGEPIDVQGANLALSSVGPPYDGGPQLRLRFDRNENFAKDPSGNQKSFMHVALHEIGHILGLSHENGFPWTSEAVMYHSYDSTVKEELTQQDRDAVVELWR